MSNQIEEIEARMNLLERQLKNPQAVSISPATGTSEEKSLPQTGMSGKKFRQIKKTLTN